MNRIIPVNARLTLWHIVEYREDFDRQLEILWVLASALLNQKSRGSVILFAMPAGIPLSAARHPRSLSS